LLEGGPTSPRVTRAERAGRERASAQHRRATALHDRAVASWCRPDAADITRRALVLLADHELNASTFATRVAVSTGAPLAAGVLSGLATLSGPLHGRASLGVLELVAGVKRAGADVTIREWLSQGRPIAGFGHPLYPQGDPRATTLLQQFTLPKPYADLRDAVEDAIGERPNVDFALAALTRVFDLPQEAPLVLFALGRCVGWLAHALEQVTTGHPIRPRARYVGPPVS
jgi:citrate synthase